MPIYTPTYNTNYPATIAAYAPLDAYNTKIYFLSY